MTRPTMLRTAIWRLCLMVIGCTMALALPGAGLLAHGMSAQTPNGKITLKGHLVPALKHLKPTGKTAGGQSLQLSIVLQPRNSGALDTLLTQLNDPHSSSYHHFLTAAQYRQTFGRTTSETQAITSFLKSQGLRVTSVAPNNLLIDASGTVATAEQAFGATIDNFSLSGRQVYAPVNEPSLPASIAGMVRAIAGLDDVAVYHSHDEIAGRAGQQVTGHGGSGPDGFYGPSDLRNAYDMNSLTTSDTGSGADIALFELDSYTASDVQQYRSYFGLPALGADNIVVDGASTTPGAGALEVELDMEVASAIAPSARQEIYIGPNSAQGVNDTYSQIATDDTSAVVSTSWGACEAFMGGAELSALDGIFQQNAAQGQAIFAAAGDAGAYDCNDNNLAVDSPADDPNVVGVGGTTLNTGTGASYLSESVWSNPADTSRSPNGAGGGGGQSQYFTLPTYQRGPNVINDYTYQDGIASREVPDVTADADPNTGYDVYCSVSAVGCSPSGAWYAVAGTSAAAPLWAGIAIDTNEYLSGLGKPTLGSANAMIYQIFNHPTPYSAFHDITSGDNLYYPAEANYDMASGVGSPDVWNFARDAANASPTAISRTWYFAEGFTGGSFTQYLTIANPNQATAHVQVTYLLGSGSPIVRSYTVNPTARLTVNVNTEIGTGQNDSMVVTSDIGVIAERPIYFTYNSGGLRVPGGTDVLGATQLNTQFDFGYLDTSVNHATYLTVLNRNAGALSVQVAYYPQAGGSPTIVTHSVPGNSRGTIYVNSDVPAGAYSAVVTLSGGSGLVERPMYLVDSTTGYTGSADVIGVQQPAANWYFAEGFTSSTFNERYILSNPTGSTAHATVTFIKSDGSTVPVPVTINPGALQIVSANAALGSTGVNNSATVTADQTIVAERFMSFSYSGSIPGASDVLGATQTGYWYGFAEGYTGSGFSEYLTLENPDPSNTAYVGITYLPANGNPPTVQVVAVGPHSRYTINTSTMMAGQSFSMVVQSGLPIVAERPMYFAYGGSQTGGSDVVGYQLF